jgi:hypothetical protein
MFMEYLKRKIKFVYDRKKIAYLTKKYSIFNNNNVA